MAERMRKRENDKHHDHGPFANFTIHETHEQRQLCQTHLDNRSMVKNLTTGPVEELAQINTISVPEEINDVCPSNNKDILSVVRERKACSDANTDNSIETYMINKDQPIGNHGSLHPEFVEIEETNTNEPEIKTQFELIDENIAEQKKNWIAKHSGVKTSEGNLFTDVIIHEDIVNKTERSPEEFAQIQQHNLEFAVVNPLQRDQTYETSYLTYDDHDVSCRQIKLNPDIVKSNISSGKSEQTEQELSLGTTEKDFATDLAIPEIDLSSSANCINVNT